jgi:hypothetical protein
VSEWGATIVGLKSRKTGHRYARLRLIPLRSVLSPDPEVLATAADFVADALHTAATTRDLLGLDGMDTRWPLFKELREILPTTLSAGLNHYAAGRTLDAAIELEAAVQEPLAGGWIIGDLENRSEFARKGKSDSHFWTALAVMQRTMVDDFTEQYAVQQSFSLTCAYYVSRLGKDAMRAVIMESAKPH